LRDNNSLFKLNNIISSISNHQPMKDANISRLSLMDF
jgi:hypothetical protein